jgi:hypothetical protein
VKLDAEIVQQARIVARRRGEPVCRYLSSLLQYSVAEDYKLELKLIAGEIAEQESLKRGKSRSK